MPVQCDRRFSYRRRCRHSHYYCYHRHYHRICRDGPSVPGHAWMARWGASCAAMRAGAVVSLRGGARRHAAVKSAAAVVGEAGLSQAIQERRVVGEHRRWCADDAG